MKNSIYWKFSYRDRNLTSDDKSDVSERDSHASKARSNRGKETEKFHIAGGKPAPIGRGEKPNQIGTRSRGDLNPDRVTVRSQQRPSSDLPNRIAYC